MNAYSASRPANVLKVGYVFKVIAYHFNSISFLFHYHFIIVSLSYHYHFITILTSTNCPLSHLSLKEWLANVYELTWYVPPASIKLMTVPCN